MQLPVRGAYTARQKMKWTFTNGRSRACPSICSMPASSRRRARGSRRYAAQSALLRAAARRTLAFAAIQGPIMCRNGLPLRRQPVQATLRAMAFSESDTVLSMLVRRLLIADHEFIAICIENIFSVSDKLEFCSMFLISFSTFFI
jgi:hypothetical protein